MSIKSLIDRIDSDIVLSGPDVSELYAKDWSEEVPCKPDVVIQPRNTEDISHVLAQCQAHGQPVVTQGGRTGLSGGATPKAKEWVLSTEKLDKIISIDADAMTITVQAGVILEKIQNAASEIGLLFPMDIGARGSCTAGGIVATNAGGTQVIQYGMTRSLVLGLVAVLPDGTVLKAHNTLIKNNSGFDLKHLLIGSEGVLGVITEITFRLFPKRPIRKTALCAIPDFKKAQKLLKIAKTNFLGLSSFEIMWNDYFVAALDATNEKNPFNEMHPLYALIEVEEGQETGAFENVLMGAIEQDIVSGVIISKNENERQKLWTIRDGISEILPLLKNRIDFDLGIPSPKMEGFIKDVKQGLSEKFKDCKTLAFGHLGDGNLHLTVSIQNPNDKNDIEKLVFSLTKAAQGAITAEHGVGSLKRKWLSYTRSKEEIVLMQALKKMIDPADILNPRRVI